MGLDANWKEPEIIRAKPSKTDIQLIKSFNNFLDAINTRRVLFEKIIKPKTNTFSRFERYNYNSEQIIIKEFRMAQIKKMVSSVSEHSLDELFGTITNDVNKNDKKLGTPFSKEDYESIYDMFA